MYMNTVQSTEKCNFAGSFTVATWLCPPFFFGRHMINFRHVCYCRNMIMSAILLSVVTWLCRPLCSLPPYDYVLHFVLCHHMIKLAILFFVTTSFMSAILFSVATWFKSAILISIATWAMSAILFSYGPRGVVTRELVPQSSHHCPTLIQSD